MNQEQLEMLVYADWLPSKGPTPMGILSHTQTKGRSTFRFQYHEDWIAIQPKNNLDPDLHWYSGSQFSVAKPNVGIFLDSMPDRWGRTLLQRRENLLAKAEARHPKKLSEVDFLLGIEDVSRMGAIRFKTSESGPFINQNKQYAVPPITKLRELQHGSRLLEEGDQADLSIALQLLVAPGSSLSGARPKANVVDEEGNLWIAKFPSKEDEIDQGSWEFLAYQLAIRAGIQMAESSRQLISGRHHTFLTRRFDRNLDQRIHFASAMTMTGKHESLLRDEVPSYLELAEFIQFSGEAPKEDLHQLWRRIIFNISISNTDDHLINHGFILGEKGWRLSPAYDLNPSIAKDHLALHIDEDNGALDLELAKSVGTYFQLSLPVMDQIIAEVKGAVTNWASEAKKLNISRADQSLMEPAFRV
ncbi:MAG: HipA domain-containing protein [Bacteroidota bacterium]